MDVSALHFLVLTVAGWISRRQGEAIEYLLEENRVLREHLGERRHRFTDGQRRRLAEKGKRLGTKRLRALASIVTPETILRWYRTLVAKKYDGSSKRGPGRPRVDEQIRLVEPSAGPANDNGQVQRKQRLGGLLSFYDRRAA